MADVGSGRRAADDDRDRGQILLVAGLVVAVGLVALVVLLNAAIYSQHLATRSTGPGADEAIEYRNVVVDATGEVVVRENAENYAEYQQVKRNVTASLSTLEVLFRRAYVEDGVVAAVVDRSYTRGQLVRQTNETRAFTNESGTADWTLATDVTRARAFTLTVTESSLPELPLTNVTDGFHVRVTNGSSEWIVYVYDNADTNTNDITVAVKNGTAANETEVCSVTADQATIDLTGGTLAGEPCPGLVWAKGVSGAVDVTYRNGKAAAGTYNLTVKGQTANGDSLAGAPTDDAPYLVPAVYSVTFDVYYEGARLTYNETVRVAPGEPS